MPIKQIFSRFFKTLHFQLRLQYVHFTFAVVNQNSNTFAVVSGRKFQSYHEPIHT